MQSFQSSDHAEALDNPNNSQVEDKIKRKILVCPWKYIEEFHEVYDWLFASTSTVETRAKALSEMQVWRLRRGSLCPAAVLATTVLLEVKLKDEENSTGRLTEDELQSLYAYAIMRFFNYMSSIMQTHNMRTMYETAKRLGLPSFVVDLRHLCAHGQVMPPLEVLRPTLQLCYVWIRDYYWTKQRLYMRSVDASKLRRKGDIQFEHNATRLFRLYDAALEGYCKGAKNLKTVKRHLHGKRLVLLKEFMNQKNLRLLRDAFDAIVKELTILIKREGLKDLTEIFNFCLLKMNYFFVVGEKHASSTKELQSVIDITKSLFRLLAAKDFIEELFIKLIVIAEKIVEPTKRRVGAAFWAIQIVNGFVAFRKCKRMHKVQLDQNPKTKEFDFLTLNCDTISNQLRKLLIYAGVDIKSTLIFGTYGMWIFEISFLEERFKKINAYTAPVVKSLLFLANPPLSEAQVEGLEILIDIQCELTLEKPTEQSPKLKENTMTSEKIYTVEDLLKKLKNNELVDSDDEKIQTVENLFNKLKNNDFSDSDDTDDAESLPGGVKKYGIWSTLPDDDPHDWSSCPLGRLPW